MAGQDNTLIRQEGLRKKAVLCDFGLARFLHTPTNLTATGAINRGTFIFLSPEGMESAVLKTTENDIWALDWLIVEVCDLSCRSS